MMGLSYFHLYLAIPCDKTFLAAIGGTTVSQTHLIDNRNRKVDKVDIDDKIVSSYD